MKRVSTILTIVFILLTASYAGLWLYSLDWMNREIDRAYTEAASQDYEFLGPKPVVRGFPFVPEIYYTQGFKSGNITLTFPELTVRGYPIPGLTFSVDTPQGLALGIDGFLDATLWSADSLHARIAVPHMIPGDLTRESMAAWQQAGGALDIRSYEMTKGAMRSDGAGLLQLDQNLQPDVTFTGNLSGYESFIQTLLAEGQIEALPAAAALGILGTMARPDPETGASVVSVTITMKNRALQIGPLQLGHLPEIVWDTRNSPALHQ